MLGKREKWLISGARSWCRSGRPGYSDLPVVQFEIGQLLSLFVRWRTFWGKWKGEFLLSASFNFKAVRSVAAISSRMDEMEEVQSRLRMNNEMIIMLRRRVWIRWGLLESLSLNSSSSWGLHNGFPLWLLLCFLVRDGSTINHDFCLCSDSICV